MSNSRLFCCVCVSRRSLFATGYIRNINIIRCANGFNGMGIFRKNAVGSRNLYVIHMRICYSSLESNIWQAEAGLNCDPEPCDLARSRWTHLWNITCIDPVALMSPGKDPTLSDMVSEVDSGWSRTQLILVSPQTGIRYFFNRPSKTMFLVWIGSDDTTNCLSSQSSPRQQRTSGGNK